MNLEKFEQISRQPAKPEDFEFVRKVHHKAYRDVVLKQFGNWDRHYQDKFFKNAWNSSPHEIILCNGEPCGYCSSEENDGRIILHELVLLPEFQGQSVGTKILNDIIEKAKIRNMPVRLQVFKANKARELYQRLGFVNTGETETHFEMEFDPSK